MLIVEMMVKVLTIICGNMDKNLIVYIVSILVSFALGFYISYDRYVPTLKSENSDLLAKCEYLNKIVTEYNNLKKTDNTNIYYTYKDSNNDNDVELSEKSHLKIDVNGNSYELPSKVKEDAKFENGKLVIQKEETTVLDITKAANEMAEIKAKQYSRTGKLDVGCIYNRKENDLYGGLRYNAKAWDIGYYHNVNGDDWLIGLHYKF